MKDGDNIRFVKGVPAAPENRNPGGLHGAKSALARYFASNATRSHLPPETVARLEEIRSRGNALLNSLKPYRDASVFNLRFAERLAADSGTAGAAAHLPASASGAIRDALDLAARDFMKKAFAAFPVKNADLETTCALSAYFFLGAAARYCPDLIFESQGDADRQKELADGFIRFYDGRLSELMAPGAKSGDARELHRLVFQSYVDFKKQMPGLFDALRKKLQASKGDFMAPFGSDAYVSSWAANHYAGSL